jgi:protein-tyrosine phosphatase
LKEIFWIGEDPRVRLAVVLRPRGSDWLEDELSRMKRNGINVLVSLLEEEEAFELGLSEERLQASQLEMTFLSFPIPDRHIPPDVAAFRDFVTGLADRVHAGEGIGVHCRGSIGRASITSACTLIHLGWEPSAALDAIEETRGCAIPDTAEQRQWILDYKVQS